MTHDPPAQRASAPHGDRRTVGVEEELLVVGFTGRPVPLAPAMLAHPAAQGVLSRELKQEQVEIASEPQTDMTALAEDLTARRAIAAEVAGDVGALVAAVATIPQDLEPTTMPDPRFAHIAAEFGLLERQQLTCGAHVHVAVRSPEEGIGVLDGIRGWLPLLMAISANSPFWRGQDTAHASTRSLVLGQLPTSGPAPLWGSLAAYEAVSDQVITTGAALDRAMLYYDARLSARYPTVEIRVADVGAHVRDDVTLATLCRALVDTEAARWQAGGPPPPIPTIVLRGAAWRAARHGTSGKLLDGTGTRLVPAWEAVDGLVAHVEEALARNGDLEAVRTALALARLRGTGADLQREAFARSGDLDTVVLDAVARTSPQPNGPTPNGPTTPTTVTCVSSPVAHP